VELLDAFSKDFYPTLDKAQQQMARVKKGMDSGLTCTECGKRMLIKFGRNGEFLACEGYPDCTNTSDFTRNEDGEIQMVQAQPEQQKPMGTCPECGSTLYLKRARTGSRFIACSGYPKCTYTQPFSTHIPCPRDDCPGELVEKSSKRGKVFYACDQYPNCTYAVWNEPVGEACPDCGSKILVRKSTKSRGEHLACPEKKCRYWREVEESEARET
jgi:DNA topoisomerase-1